MSTDNNKVAKKLADFILALIADQSITDTSRIHVFMDDLDITTKAPRYHELLALGKINEAFAVPDIVQPFAFPVLKFLYRQGIKVNIFTARTSTERVEKTGKSIMEVNNLPFLFNSFICVRENEKVFSVAAKIDETVMPSDGQNIAILYSPFNNMLDAFEKYDLRNYCSVARGLKMDI